MVPKDVVLRAHNVETGLVGHFLAKQPDHRAAKNHKKQYDQIKLGQAQPRIIPNITKLPSYGEIALASINNIANISLNICFVANVLSDIVDMLGRSRS